MSPKNLLELADSLLDEGVKLYNQKKFREAEIRYKEALKILPSSETLMYNLALVYLEQKKYTLSWELVNKIKDLDCRDIIAELKKSQGIKRKRTNKSAFSPFKFMNSMKCLSLTRSFRRCENKADFLFCHIHKYQRFFYPFYLLTFIVLISDFFHLITPSPDSKEKTLLEIPLSPDERQKFKTTIFSMFAAFRLDPINRAIALKDSLANLVKVVEKNSTYEKELLQETAILYRLYSASILFSAKDVNIDFNTYIEKAYPYLKRSLNLDPSLWEKSHERSSYQFVKKFFENKAESLPAEELIFTLFSIAMVKADSLEVKNKMRPYWEKMVELAGDPKNDYEYFKNFRQQSGKKLSYGALITGLEFLTLGQGGKFEGPFFLPTENGKTLVRYIISPLNKPPVYLEWIVDKEKNLIEPQTLLARDLHSIIMKGRDNSP